MIRVAVAGALGRMGTIARSAVREADDLEYVGGFARRSVPQERIVDDLEALLASTAPDVLVDFTTYPTTLEVAHAAITQGVSPVVGATGWSDRERGELERAAIERGVGAMLVPNFAVGAVLMMRFAEEAARFFPTAEIVEIHHDGKRDKPSGTAKLTAERVAGAGGPAEVPIHSVRLRGAVAHQEVLFGNTGEMLTIRHDSLSRESFAAGIVYAVRHVRELRGLSVGLQLDWSFDKLTMTTEGGVTTHEGME